MSYHIISIHLALSKIGKSVNLFILLTPESAMRERDVLTNVYRKNSMQRKIRVIIGLFISAF